jgi:hypothetical protein
LVGILAAAQASRWFLGISMVSWRVRGSSTKVAIRPETTCHSM